MLAMPLTQLNITKLTHMAPSGHVTKVTHFLLQLLIIHIFGDTNVIHFVNQITKVTHLEVTQVTNTVALYWRVKTLHTLLPK